jgi:signal transduction histidine kinase
MAVVTEDAAAEGGVVASLRDANEETVRDVGAFELGRVEDPNAVAEPIDLGSVLREVAAHGREHHPEAEVVVEPTEATALAGDELVRALEELVGNAVRHTVAPTVELSVTTTDERVHVHVDDDGAGLPECEQPVFAGEADITQGRHSRGPWLAKCVTEFYGGEFDVTVEEGTRVTLSLPRAE